MMSSRNRNRNRRRLHVVKESNPVQEDTASPGINTKQMVKIGAITAATGTVVGAVVMELYRYLRQKIPVPQAPTQAAQAMQSNPWTPQAPFSPSPVFPSLSSYPPAPQPPVPGQSPMPYAQPNPYGQQNPYAPQFALPPTPQEIVPAPVQVPVPVPAPAPAPAPAASHEPLSRPELAQWQRGLEAWEHRLDRRDNDS